MLFITNTLEHSPLFDMLICFESFEGIFYQFDSCTHNQTKKSSTILICLTGDTWKCDLSSFGLSDGEEPQTGTSLSVVTSFEL